jgi:DEAD/DEAH box helicase domain-containing protein
MKTRGAIFPSRREPPAALPLVEAVYDRAMDARGFLADLSAQGGDGSLAHVEVLEPRDPVIEALPEVPDVLRRRLAMLGIEGLYPHQRQALDSLDAGRNVIVATGTASGKTLVYNLAFARTAIADEKRTALYLFPTKALARDQLRQVRALKLPQVRAAVYDGDTPQAERPLIRRNANLVMTNPDMLHASILPGHPRWADFLLRLSLVVVDEAHVARGVFGSHVGMILRRLRRLVAHYGGQPRFVLASATIGNPADLAERLVGDASPRGEKLFVLWNPPLVDEELGLRRSAITEASWMLRDLVEREVRTIAFCRSRRAAELVAEFARRELPGGLKRRVKAYRAGYLAEERRQLERALASGELLGVAATTALELGIDVGSLDAALLAGYPGTRASLWQQAGRAGRRSDSSLAMLIAQDDPLDQYLVQHPTDLFQKPPEAAVVDPTNPYILEPHLACAAREQPMTKEEVEAFGEGAPDAVERLVGREELFWRKGLLYHRGRESPHRRVDIRSASGSLFAIVDGETGALLGTVDEARAYWHVHPGAVYLHQGEQYEVSELDLDRKVAVVAKSAADYYTQTRDLTDIEVLRVIDQGSIGEVPALFGEVKVTRQVIGFQRKLSSTQEVLDEVGLDLPPQTLVTKALWWILPKRLLLRARITAAMLPGTAHAAEHAAIGLLPLVATCDRWDVGGLSTPFHPDTGAATIFIYDGYAGGAGIAERGYESGHRLLEATFEAVRQCPCAKGCPSCVQSPKCGNGNEPLDKQGAVALLAAMLDRTWG